MNGSGRWLIGHKRSMLCIVQYAEEGCGEVNGCLKPMMFQLSPGSIVACPDARSCVRICLMWAGKPIM